MRISRCPIQPLAGHGSGACAGGSTHPQEIQPTPIVIPGSYPPDVGRNRHAIPTHRIFTLRTYLLWTEGRASESVRRRRAAENHTQASPRPATPGTRSHPYRLAYLRLCTTSLATIGSSVSGPLASLHRPESALCAVSGVRPRALVTFYRTRLDGRPKSHEPGPSLPPPFRKPPAQAISPTPACAVPCPASEWTDPHLLAPVTDDPFPYGTLQRPLLCDSRSNVADRGARARGGEREVQG